MQINRPVKLRKISSKNNNTAFGVTIPIEIANNYQNTFFHVSEHDGIIMLTSGCHSSVFTRSCKDKQ